MFSADQRQFLHNELFRLTLEGAMQRSKVYAGNEQVIPELARKQFQRTLRNKLESLSALYAVSQTDDAHIQNIQELADCISRAHSNILSGGRFRIGCAQKALNLFLKYLWCLGEIPTPPHCPFDGIIIGKLRLEQPINWTTLDSLTGYQTLVDAARSKAGLRSLAEWELNVFKQPSA